MCPRLDDPATRNRPRRRGAALVEFAMVLPALVVVLFAFLEFTRYVCVVHAVEEAARVGCREAILGTATESSVKAEISAILLPFGIKTYTVTITPDPSSTVAPGNAVTVAVNVKYADVSWLPTPAYLGSSVISLTSTLPKEN